MRRGQQGVRWLVPAASLAIAVLLSDGCLYIPTSESAPPMQGQEVRPEDTAFLKTGETTKQEVIGRFGNATMFWRDENILIYRWVKRQGVMLWAVGGPYAASIGAADIPEEYAFLLKFDANDRYVNSETLTKPALKSYGDFLLEWRDAQRARGWKPKETPQ